MAHTPKKVKKCEKGQKRGIFYPFFVLTFLHLSCILLFVL
uniref:Uncharacterized protein n=1 Tax=uncultured bacterium contig00056 TaxID=1181540 RepID=A0A806KNR2_9BACT|nr:hypothetical protein [uncultured bacterium contig00056]